MSLLRDQPLRLNNRPRPYYRSRRPLSAPIRAVQRRIANYRLPEAGESWPTIAPFVRDTVTSLDLRTVDVTSHYLSTTAKFTFWAWQSHGVALDAEEVFRLDLVAMFNEQKMRNLSDTYRAATAQRLSRLVAHTSGVAPVRQKRTSHIAPIYTDTQLMHHRGSALAHTTESRRANAHLVLGLGAGAGLRPEEIALLRVGDIQVEEPHATVTVRGKHPRVVPVKNRWVPSLVTGLGDRPADEWAFTGYRLPEYPARVIHQFGIDTPTILTASVTRLRATWIVGLLNQGLPLDLILNLSGLATVVSLDSFVRAMQPHPIDQHLTAIIGAELPR
jgi:integrase